MSIFRLQQKATNGKFRERIMGTELYTVTIEFKGDFPDEETNISGKI